MTKTLTPGALALALAARASAPLLAPMEVLG